MDKLQFLVLITRSQKLTQQKFEIEKTDAIILSYTDSMKVTLSLLKIEKNKILKHVWT